MFKSFIESDRKKAQDFFLDRQKMHEGTKNKILIAALIGGPISIALVSSQFGTDVGTVCFFFGAISYVLGYSYCQSMWNKEREEREYFKALNEYERESGRGA